MTRRLEPTDPLTVYAGSETALFVTQDGGASWSETLPTGQQVNAVAVDPLNGARVLATTEGNGVFLTEDGALVWDESSTGLDPTIDAVAVYARDSVINVNYFSRSTTTIFAGFASRRAMEWIRTTTKLLT